MMSTLSRLKHETEAARQRQSRKVYVSSSEVQAFLVANNRKERISQGAPLTLALPGDATPSGVGSLLLEASVGSELRWTLSSINHVLRTVSKWGEPTYLFAATPADEVEHLESVLGRACQLTVAEKRPVQLPDGGQVLKGLGKGIKALMTGLAGGGGGSSSRQQPQRDQEDEEAAERERAAYAAARSGGDAGSTPVAVHGRPYEDARPSAPTYASAQHLRPDERDRGGRAGRLAPQGTTAMGMRDRADAGDRLARLKAELAQEGQPPAAPDVAASPAETARYQQQQPQQAYASSADSDSDSEWVIFQQQGNRWDAAPPAGGRYPAVPGAYSGGGGTWGDTGAADSRRRDQQWAGTAQPGAYESAGEPQQYQRGGSAAGGAVKQPWGREAGGVAAAKSSELQRKAERARLEWEQAQREEAAAAAQRAQRDQDAGWGDGGGNAGKRQQEKQQQQQPDWAELLGKVFGGGLAYPVAAPDL